MSENIMGIEFDVQPKLRFYGERGRNRWGYCMLVKERLFDCYAMRFRGGYVLFKKCGNVKIPPTKVGGVLGILSMLKNSSIR